MKEQDKARLIDRYQSRLAQFGAVPAAIGEPKQRQRFYFHFLLDSPEFSTSRSLLDVGCGYGDLEEYLRQAGWSGRYTGIDIVPAIVEAAHTLRPEVDIRLLDLEIDTLEEHFDWVTSIGVLTGKTTEIDYYCYLESMLGKMWERSLRGVSFNLFSPYVDFQHPVHAHPDMGKVIEIVRKFSRRFAIRNDFMPYEYAVYVYRDDAVTRELSIFSAHQSCFDKVCRSAD